MPQCFDGLIRRGFCYRQPYWECRLSTTISWPYSNRRKGKT